MRRAVVYMGVLASAGVMCWVFPLFHVVSLREAEVEKKQSTFDAAERANAFWTGQLPLVTNQAAEVATVLAAIDNDPRQARDEYSRSVGIGRAYYYFIRGRGTVVSVDERGVGVAVAGQQSKPDVVLATGLLFGNAVRDATGLLNASDFANLRHFNDISTELNRIVERSVIPSLKKQAETGRRVQFVGCAEIRDERRDLRPLRVIPVEVQFE